MQSQMIGILALQKSELNARRSVSKSGIDELKASIMAHGLMQNLVVAPINGKMKYTVVAGGRRLQALQELLAEGKIDDAYTVPCQVIEGEQPDELSLAENVVREAMHPADEFEAFTHLVNQGSTPDEVATRFGQTEKHVQQRLKMGRVHSDIIKQYRLGKINLECVMAFTISDDQEYQLKVFKGLSDWERNPGTIKNKMTSKMLKPDAAAVKFVGLQAYKDAGGNIIEDLFGEATFLTDKKIVDRLYSEKVNDKVEQLKKAGWSWVHVDKRKNWSFTSGMKKITGKTKEDKAKAGCYVYFDEYHGKLEVEYGLVKPTGKEVEKTTSPSSRSTYTPPTEAEKIVRDFRHEMITASLLQAPDLAIDYLMFVTAVGHFDESVWQTSGISVELRGNGYNSDNAEQIDTVAKKEIGAARAGIELHLDWLKKKTESARFEEFQKLTAEQKRQLLAFAVAASFDAEEPEEGNAAEPLLSLIGIDVAKYWQPTKKSYFEHMTEAELLKLGTEVLGKEWAAAHKGAKPDKLATSLEQAFNNPPADRADAIKTWLPKGLEFTAPVKVKARKKAA